MPPLKQHQSAQTTKMLLIGDSGGGKTGALASLAEAGYNLRILDVDNGIDVLANMLKDKPQAMDRVEFETVTDQMVNRGGRLVPKTATVWQRCAKLLDNWKTETADLGPLTSWTPQDVLVIDSLTFISAAALNFVLSMDAKLGQRPQLQHWGDAQSLIEGLLGMLYDDGVKCNVIVTSHITFLGDEGNMTGYPSTLGKALPPKVGRYFNNTLFIKVQGQGSNVRRKIFTTPTGMVATKNSSPSKVKTDYPIETGLADFFKDLRS